jgi:hypothetical protein
MAAMIQDAVCHVRKQARVNAMNQRPKPYVVILGDETPYFVIHDDGGIMPCGPRHMRNNQDRVQALCAARELSVAYLYCPGKWIDTCCV